ncbi:MAG: multidrug ABC transporter ATP-binding protein [Bacteroidetes bacterium 43-16]|nr:MAG: multidrug ABC transporter ATP-binding protein [Bacteroidetes bacterium 43-16]
MQLVIKDLNKVYPNGVKPLNNINLTIDKGLFGLLGPNGAGKSSLMRTIAALQNPDSGSIMLGDIDVINDKTALRKVLGYLPQDFGFYPKVSALELLNHFAVLKGISNKGERKELVAALLQQTNLYEARHRNVSDYSGGMRQRFGIAQALIGNPKLVIVDEPTAGLDPMERNRFQNLLSEIATNTIVILSTHIVDDVKNLCKKMVIMNQGTILYEGNPKDALEEVRGRIWQKSIDNHSLGAYRAKYNAIFSSMVHGALELRIFSESDPGDGFTLSDVGLEDVYFSTIVNNLPKKD